MNTELEQYLISNGWIKNDLFCNTIYIYITDKTRIHLEIKQSPLTKHTVVILDKELKLHLDKLEFKTVIKLIENYIIINEAL